MTARRRASGWTQQALPDWTAARCRTELDHRQAVQVCADCPLVAPCLRYAAETQSTGVVMGGIRLSEYPHLAARQVNGALAPTTTRERTR